MKLHRKFLIAAGGLAIDILDALKSELEARMPEAVRAAIVEEIDETEGWAVPAQEPRTAASRALEYHPAPRRPAMPPPAPLAGSRAARVRGARGSE